jgi:hypothetical protein
MRTMLALARHYARSKQYNSTHAPRAKKSTNRPKNRGPIMAANRNQNLIGLLLAQLYHNPKVRVQSQIFKCSLPKCTEFQTIAPKIESRIVEISGLLFPPPSSC